MRICCLGPSILCSSSEPARFIAVLTAQPEAAPATMPGGPRKKDIAPAVRRPLRSAPCSINFRTRAASTSHAPPVMPQMLVLVKLNKMSIDLGHVSAVSLPTYINPEDGLQRWSEGSPSLL